MTICVLRGTSVEGDPKTGLQRMTTDELLSVFAQTALSNNGKVLLKSDARISPQHVSQCDQFVLYTSAGAALIGNVEGVGQSYSPDTWPSPRVEPYRPIPAFAKIHSRFWVKLSSVQIFTRNFPAWKYVKEDDPAISLDEALKVRGRFSVIYGRNR